MSTDTVLTRLTTDASLCTEVDRLLEAAVLSVTDSIFPRGHLQAYVDYAHAQLGSDILFEMRAHDCVSMVPDQDIDVSDLVETYSIERARIYQELHKAVSGITWPPGAALTLKSIIVKPSVRFYYDSSARDGSLNFSLDLNVLLSQVVA